jgi:serine/threonine protein kinase
MFGFGTTSYTMGKRTIDVGQLVSEGGYAYVYRATDRATGETFALKKVIC